MWKSSRGTHIIVLLLKKKVTRQKDNVFYLTFRSKAQKLLLPINKFNKKWNSFLVPCIWSCTNKLLENNIFSFFHTLTLRLRYFFLRTLLPGDQQYPVSVGLWSYYCPQMKQLFHPKMSCRWNVFSMLLLMMHTIPLHSSSCVCFALTVSISLKSLGKAVFVHEISPAFHYLDPWNYMEFQNFTVLEKWMLCTFVQICTSFVMMVPSLHSCLTIPQILRIHQNIFSHHNS